MQNNGASPDGDRATRPTDQAPAGLGDTASVPSAAKYALMFNEGGERVSVAYDLGAQYFSDCVEVRQYDSDSFELHVPFDELRWLAARLLDCASAIEAQRAADSEAGAVHESAGPKDDAHE